VMMVEQLDPQPTKFYNPAYHLALWNAMGWLGGGLALLERLTDTSGPPVATGQLRFVKRSGGPAGTFTTIGDAINAAVNGDTILILDQETYTEAVVLENDKPISLMSTSQKRPTDQSLDYPILNGQGNHRPLRIQDISSGVAHISRLKITGGLSSVNQTTGSRGDGGGILVARTDNVVITDCAISNCATQGMDPFGGGNGGGIAVYHASPAIINCLITENHAANAGSGIGVYGYGWPAILGCSISRNRSVELATSADGGGIAIGICATNTEDQEVLRNTSRSDLPTRFDQGDLQRARNHFVRITGCKILRNEANDDGGGIYISIASRVIVRDTLIQENKANADGGGIRLSLDSEVRILHCQIILNEDNLGNQKAGGGGISARNPRLIRLERTLVLDNTVHGFAGGGLYFVSTDEGDFAKRNVLFDPPFDWNDFLLHPQIFNHTESTLMIDATNNFESNHATDGNHGKGGGMYLLRFRGPRQKPELGQVDGQPIHVFLGNGDVLKQSNEASFANSNRLYLEDMVDGTIKRDTDLPSRGAFTYDSTQPSRPLYP
jgi:Right handed beta helix region